MVGKKNSSKYRKKRRGFGGQRRQEIEREDNGESRNESMTSDVGPSTSTPVKTADEANRSLEKISINCPILEKERSQVLTRKRAKSLGLESIAMKRRKKVHEKSYIQDAHGFKLMKANKLQHALSQAAICGSCKSPKGKLILLQADGKRVGLDEELILKCTNCQETTLFRTSPRMKTAIGKSSEVNFRCAQAGIETGLGLTNLQKLCTAFDLPLPLSHAAYNDLMKKCECCYSNEADASLKKAALNLKNMVKEKDPNCKDLDPLSDIFEVSVSVDGTWQKRYGYSSLHGVVFVVAIDTGEVLDYEIRSKVCFQCKSKEHKKASAEYQTWWESHRPVCEINHYGSAESMEKDAAVKMFLRSIAKHNLKYTTYVGDGDSSSYGVVADAVFQKYGPEYLVLKEDCIGHIQKRMGNGLRSYKKGAKGLKLADGGNVGGRGRLTDVVIDSFQNYYGYAIRANTNNLEKMQNSVWAIYFHSIEGSGETLEEQHKYCPKGRDSWCKYQNDIVLNTKSYERAKCLPSVFRKELHPIFKRLSSESLLRRCLRGLTQNQNESLNNMLWQKCPKRVFCGRRRLETATAAAVLQWNKGSGAVSDILNRFGINDAGVNTLRGCRWLNNQRLINAAQKCKSKYLNQRRLLRRKRKEFTKLGKITWLVDLASTKFLIVQKTRKRPQRTNWHQLEILA